MYNNGGSLVLQSNDPGKGNLYVGGYDSLNGYQQNKIGAILSAVWVGNQKGFEKVQHLLIEADDNPNYDMSKYFDKAVEFITENLKTTNVLVHCAAGISRSVCLVVAYLIKVHKMTPQAALAKIREKRPWAGPNQGFTQQLEKYYSALHEQ